MEKNNFAECLKEMMNQYDSKKAEWVAKFGNEKGFDKYFTGQVSK